MASFVSSALLSTLLLVNTLLTQAQAVSFAPVATYAAGVGAHPIDVAVGDVNGDGNLDAVLANTGTLMVGVLLGNGNGLFQPVVTYPAGGSCSSVSVADVNGDGAADILMANPNSGTIGVLLSNGAGAFQPTVVYYTGAETITVADINGDGKLDLLLADGSASSTFAVMLGNGNGTFQAKTTYPTGTFFPSGRIRVADVNRDGLPDLVIAFSGSNAVGVLLGNATGSFQPAVTYPSCGPTGSNSRTGSSPADLVVSDVNGDGNPDLLITNTTTGNLQGYPLADSNTAGVLLGNGNGTFQPVTLYPVGSAATYYSRGATPVGIAVADMNGDGKPDFITSNYGANAVGVFIGNGNGTFQAMTTFSTSAGSSPYGPAVADVNKDGKPDVLTANIANYTLGVLLNATTYTPLATVANTPTVQPRLWPNPVLASGPFVTFYISNLKAGVYTLDATLVNALGQAAAHTVAIANSGDATIMLLSQRLAPGVYVVQLTAHDAQGQASSPLFTQRISLQ